MQLKGADIFVEVLVEQGVDTMFGYPGGAVLDLYDALYKNQDRICHVMTAHEQGAAHAADGYARVTGKTGVVLATSGPGATNLVTGIATAYMDSVPMVAITGNVTRPLTGKDSFQEVYIAGITMPITKHNFIVDDVKNLAPMLRKAFEIAQTGRKGPVLVDIPKDVMSQIYEYEPEAPAVDTYETVIKENKLQAVADAINKAERPVIYFGGGVPASFGCDNLRQIMAKSEIPATYTLMAAGVLGSENPLNLGLIGMHGNRTSNMAINEADCLIAIGTRFSDRVALNTGKFAGKAVKIQIDIDPSEISKNVVVDYNLVGDANVIMGALLPLLDEKKHPEWIAQIREWQATDYHPTDNDAVLMPHQIMKTIAELSGPDTVYVTDVGQHQMWAAQYVQQLRSRSFLTSGGLGTMGYGYGAAIGAKEGCPDRPVVHITGDGSFHMNLNEACTAVSYELPIITVIFNNQVLGMVRQWQKIFYGGRYSSTDPHRKTNFVGVIEGFGGKGYHCENLEEFRAAFADAMTQKGPVWIECMINKDERVLPMIPGGGTVDQMIMS